MAVSRDAATPTSTIRFALWFGLVVAIAIWCGLLTFVIQKWYELEGQNPWSSWLHHPSPWCERERTESLIREPSNTFSDFSFLATGLFQIWAAWHDWLVPNKTNVLMKFPIISILCGIMNIAHAFGTMMYHSCMCWVGHVADVAGMYSVTIWPAFYVLLVLWIGNDPTIGKSLTRRQLSLLQQDQDTSSSCNSRMKVWAMMLAYAGFYGMMWATENHETYTDRGRDIFMGFLVVISLTTSFVFIRKTAATSSSMFAEDDGKRNVNTIVWSTLCFLIGLSAQVMDRHLIYCNPDSWIQGHAFWHVINSFTLLLLYAFFRTMHVLPSLSRQTVKRTNGRNVLALMRRTFAIGCDME